MTKYAIMHYFDMLPYIFEIEKGGWKIVCGPYMSVKEAEADLNNLKNDETPL